MHKSYNEANIHIVNTFGQVVLILWLLVLNNQTWTRGTWNIQTWTRGAWNIQTWTRGTWNIQRSPMVI